MARPLKSKTRYAMGISSEEYYSVSPDMRRDFMSICLITTGYLGYFYSWNNTLRVFVFEIPESAEKAHREAKKLGFTSAGLSEEPIFIKNTDLERPHLDHLNRKQYYREYYR